MEYGVWSIDCYLLWMMLKSSWLDNWINETDVDECRLLVGLCRNGRCRNNVGSFSCECADGYTLAEDGQNCRDINECTEVAGFCISLLLYLIHIECSLYRFPVLVLHLASAKTWWDPPSALVLRATNCYPMEILVQVLHRTTSIDDGHELSNLLYIARHLTETWILFNQYLMIMNELKRNIANKNGWKIIVIGVLWDSNNMNLSFIWTCTDRVFELNWMSVALNRFTHRTRLLE